MIEKYLSKLDDNFSKDGFFWSRSLELPELSINPVIFSNVTQLDFENMYSGLIVELNNIGGFNDNVLDQEFINSIDRSRKFLSMEDDQSDQYKKERTESRMLYSKLRSKFPLECGKFHNLISLMYHDLIENNPNIIQINVDRIYFTGDLDVSHIPLEYDVENIIHFMPLGKNKSIMIDSNGELKHSHGIMRDYPELVSLLQSKFRDSKLDELFI